MVTKAMASDIESIRTTATKTSTTKNKTTTKRKRTILDQENIIVPNQSNDDEPKLVNVDIDVLVQCLQSSMDLYTKTEQ